MNNFHLALNTIDFISFLTFSVFIGWSLNLFFYPFLLYFSKKKKLYLLYSAYIFFTLIVLTADHNYFFSLFGFSSFEQSLIYRTSSGISFIFLLFFTLHFFNCKNYSGGNSKYFVTAMLGVGILLYASTFFDFLTFNFERVWISYEMLCVLLVVLYAHYNAQKFVEIYLAALGGALSLFTLYFYWFNEFFLLILGFAWFMSFLSFAIIRQAADAYTEKSLSFYNQTQNKMFYLQSRYASLGEITGNIAHEWKQPLNAVGAIQNSIKAALMFQGGISKDKLLESIETSFRLIRHLAETIDTFYSFLTPQEELNASFQIYDVFESIRKMTEYSFENGKIKLSIEADRNLSIRGDANEFIHALLNLILNAKDAFEETQTIEPHVTILVTKKDASCIITVKDNAGGIKMEPINKIFDWHISSKFKSSGIGLYITKNIIEKRFGGIIDAKNEDGGACFSIEIPYSEYGEHFTAYDIEEKLSLKRIRQLSKQVLELKELEKMLIKWADIFKHARWAIALHVGTNEAFENTNPAFYMLYGYSREELKKIHITDLFAPESLPIFPIMQKQAFDTGHARFEAIHKRKDGSFFPVMIELIVVRDEKEEVLYHMANIWDLTEQKAVEELLKLKKFAVDNIHEAIFMADQNSDFAYVNEKACSSLGYTQDELLSLNVGDVDPYWPKEKWPQFWEMLKIEKSALIETLHRKKDGALFHVEVRANYFEYNGIGYNLALARDITEQKKITENLLLKEFALDKINEAVFLIDKDSMFHYVNEGACKALGYTKEELLTKGVIHIDPNVSVDWWREHWKDIKRHGTTLGVTEHIKKDGTTYPIEVSSNYFEYNGVEYSLAVSRDITERIRLEEQKENERTRLFFERQLVGMAITSPTKGWLHVNDKLQQILGYTFEELKNITWAELTHPEDLADNVKLFDRLLLGEIEDYTIEKRYIRKDGSIVCTNLAVSCVRNDDGTANYILALMEDITERKELELILEKERKFLTDAQRVANTGSWYLDIKNDLLSWSDETYRIFELDKENIDNLHKTFYECVHPDDREIVSAPYLESLKTGVPYEIEHRIVMSDGRIKYVIERCEHVYENDGSPLYSIGTVQDITDRKLAEDAIRALNETLEIKVQERTTELIKKEQEFRTLAENIPGFLVRYNPDGQRVYANAAFCNYFGVSAEEIIGTTSASKPVVKEHHILTDNIQKVLLTQEITEAEISNEREGKTVWWNLTFAPEFSENREITSIICIGQDITQIKEAEIEIQEREQKFHDLFRLSPAAVSITSLECHMYLEVNESFLYHTQYTRDEVIGHSSAELGVFANPDDRTAFFQKVLQDGFVRDFEYAFKAKDGSIGYATAYASVITLNGEKCLLSHSYDRTGKKLAEDALKEREETFRAMVENSPDVIIRYDIQGYRTYINPIGKTLMNKPLEELLGKTPEEYSPLPDTSEFKKLFSKVIIQGEEITLEAPYKMPDGEIRWGEQRIVPEKNAQGEVTNVLLIGRDLTERKKLQQQLHLVNSAIDSSTDAVYINDTNLSIIYVNEGACKMLGYSKEELTSMKIYDIDATFTKEQIFALRTQTIDMQQTSFETKHKTKSGEVIDVEISGNAFLFNDTKVIVSVVKDITEHKKMQEILKQSEQRYKEIFENSFESIYLLEVMEDGKLLNVDVNPAFERIIGIPREILVGAYVGDLTDEATTKTVMEKYRRCIEAGCPTQEEVELDLPIGKRRFHSILIPIKDKNNKVKRIIGISKDITDFCHHCLQ